MQEVTHYTIEIRGSVSDRAIRPVVDEFAIDRTERGNTRLVGPIRDAAHLGGILAHFTSLGIQVVRLGPADEEGKQP